HAQPHRVPPTNATARSREEKRNRSPHPAALTPPGNAHRARARRHRAAPAAPGALRSPRRPAALRGGPARHVAGARAAGARISRKSGVPRDQRDTGVVPGPDGRQGFPGVGCGALFHPRGGTRMGRRGDRDRRGHRGAGGRGVHLRLPAGSGGRDARAAPSRGRGRGAGVGGARCRGWGGRGGQGGGGGAGSEAGVGGIPRYRRRGARCAFPRLLRNSRLLRAREARLLPRRPHRAPRIPAPRDRLPSPGRPRRLGGADQRRRSSTDRIPGLSEDVGDERQRGAGGQPRTGVRVREPSFGAVQGAGGGVLGEGGEGAGGQGARLLRPRRGRGAGHVHEQGPGFVTICY
ncbi:hypothetical protein DFJ74DRAFT_49286, partial [Hyaloraphidium curvatum]